MDHEIIYCVEINRKDTHKSFDYKTSQDANDLYNFLVNEFSNYIIKDKNSVVRSRAKIVQLKISPTYIGSIPSNVMASFIPEQWFNENVYEDMLEAAEQYYENEK